MKTIEKKIPVYRSVIKYVAEDGVEFDTEKKALEHDENLKQARRFSEIPKKRIECDILQTSWNEWYYARNEEDLNLIIDTLHEKHADNYCNGQKFNRKYFKVGDWITATYDDNGNSRPYNSFYTLDYIKTEYKKFLKNFE